MSLLCRWPAALPLLLALVTSGCQQVDRLVAVAPRVLSPGADLAPRPGVALAAPTGETTQTAPDALPPEQPTDGFDFQPIGPDAGGNLRFQVRLLAGGSPYLVAAQKLTPLFRVDGKGPVEYVADAYFRANPGRTPQSMQPGDGFVLTVPADTFVVRWQQEQTADLGGPTRLRDYVSERGDRLRFYLTDHFPILYELEPADGSGLAVLMTSPDLSYLLGSGRLDPVGLAKVVYRVPDPDLYQVDAMRRLAATVKTGESTQISVDRTRAYLDPVREAMAHARSVERVADPQRDQVVRATFSRDDGTPYMAVEDALGPMTDLSRLPRGQVFRIEYLWDGTVRVWYLTGDDDGRGRRDPYQLRENERWAELYGTVAPGKDSPVAWGPGEPSDLETFPTARDPNRRVQDGERSYDYLVPGQPILLTFRPIRSVADAQAEAELRAALRSLRDQYQSIMGQLQDSVPEIRR
jgi:hypothetical protein